MYEMRDDIPGVTFTRGGHTDWTRVRKSDLDKATGHHEGNGTSTAPRRAAMKKLQTKYAKEVAYREISELQAYYLDEEIPVIVMSGYL